MTSIRDFLKKIGFIQTWQDMQPVEEAFIDHMEKGLKGEPSSLPMLPAYLTADALHDESSTVLVMDAGGTNLRVFEVQLEPGQKPKVLYQHKQPMPGKEKPLTRPEFFRQMAEAVLPVADHSDRIGLCFSFPCRIRPDFDGEILYLDKEITVEGIEGALVAEGLNAALADLGCHTRHSVVVLNDTVAALLGALAEHPAECFSGYIGMILGTGTNCCYLERNDRVLKDATLQSRPGSSIINMEAGAFNALPITTADVWVSRGSKVAEQNLAEKMMSGAYQGRLLDGLITCAIEAGCFSDAFAARYHALDSGLTAVDISAFTLMPAHPGRLHDLAGDGEDAQALYALVDALLERAAMLAVMNLTAIMRFTQSGTDPLRPVCVAIEGTTFAKNEAFRQKIHAYLIEYTQKVRGYYCRIFSTEDANMVGSAIAARG